MKVWVLSKRKILTRERKRDNVLGKFEKGNEGEKADID